MKYKRFDETNPLDIPDPFVHVFNGISGQFSIIDCITTKDKFHIKVSQTYNNTNDQYGVP